MIRKFILIIVLVTFAISFSGCGILAHQVDRTVNLLTAPLR